MKVGVVSGDISRVPADAIITAINSSGMWYGGIDGVIKRAAGESFHSQAAAMGSLAHGQTIVAKGRPANKAAFRNVVFVVDDLRGKLREIVFSGLAAAHDAGFGSVSLPTIRMGVMLGVVEKNATEAVAEMMHGIGNFREKYPNTGLQEITIVVFNDPDLLGIIENQMPK